MTEPDRDIPQRELRNHVSAVLREVAAGARLRVTVDGRPVADLLPIQERARFVPWGDVERILRDAPLDTDFRADVMSVVPETIDEL